MPKNRNTMVVADGPPRATPATLIAGMRGDRGFVIFSTPGEISAFIKLECSWTLALAKRRISRCA